MVVSKVEAANKMPNLKSSEPFMPLETPASFVDKCELLSVQFAARPYDYSTNGLAFWDVYKAMGSEHIQVIRS